MHFKVANLSTGRATAIGTVELTVPSECGNGECEFDETCGNCVVDCGTCPVEQAPSGSSGGGGGGARDVVSFAFDPQYIEERFSQGEYESKTIEVKNKGSKGIEVGLSVSNIEEFVFLDEKSLSVPRDKSNSFEALFSVGQDTESSVYVGSIKGESSNVEKELPIVITVYEKEGPFLVDISIPEVYRVIYPGEIVLGEITITNMLNTSVFLDVEYSIKSQDEETISYRSNSVSLSKGRNEFEEVFGVAEDMIPGYYLFYVSLDYESRIYSSASIFRVGPPERLPFSLQSYVILGIVLILIGLWVLFLLAKRRKKSKKKKVTLIKIEEIDEGKLVDSTIAKLDELKKSGDVDRYFSIMRHFFAKFYSVGFSLTFEEIVSALSNKKVKNKVKVISFINKISHVPYQSKEISKIDLDKMIVDSISLVKCLKSRNKKVVSKRGKKRPNKRNKKRK